MNAESELLDLEKLLRLLDQTGQFTQAIEGKDVILLLAPTGAGKSTIAHYLAGSKLVFNRGFYELDSSEPITDENLRQIKIGHSANSETKCLIPVKLFIQDREVYLCDTPGFDDTSGGEVDIANIYGLVKAAQTCNSILPVAIISFPDLEGKLEGLVKIAKILDKMVSEFDRHFVYLFAKFDQNYDIKRMIEQFLGKQDLDNASQRMAQAIKEQLKNYSASVDILDQAKARDLLVRLVNDADKWITNSSQVFATSLSCRSERKLKEKLSSILQTTRDLLVSGDYELISDQMRQLKRLAAHLPGVESVTISYKTLCDTVRAHLNDVQSKSHAILANQINNHNRLTQVEIESLKKASEIFTIVQNILQEHFPESDRLDYAGLLKDGLNNSAINLSGFLNNHSFQDGYTHFTWLDNLIALCDNFDAVEPTIYQDLYSNLIHRLEKTAARHFGPTSDTINLNLIAEELLGIRSLEAFLANLPKDENGRLRLLQEIKPKVNSQLYCQGLRNQLEQTGQHVGLEDIENILTNPRFHSLRDDLDGIKEIIDLKMKRKIQEIVKDIGFVIDGYGDDVLSCVEPLFSDLVKIGSPAGDALRKTRADIVKFAKSRTNDLAAKLNVSQKHGEDIDFESIISWLDLLCSSADFLKLVQPNLYSLTYEKLETKIWKHFKHQTDHIVLSVYDHANVDQAVGVYESLKRVLNLVNDGDEPFRNGLEGILKDLESAFSKTLDEIEKRFRSDEGLSRSEASSTSAITLQDRELLECSLSFLKKLEKLNKPGPIKDKADQVVKIKEAYFANYCESVERGFEQCLHSLEQLDKFEDRALIVANLNNYLRSVRNLKERYDMIYAAINKYAEYDLSELVIDLVRTHAVTIRIKAVSAFNHGRDDKVDAIVDNSAALRFIGNESLSRMFEDIHSEFSKKQDDYITEIVKSLESRLESFDYVSARFELSFFENLRISPRAIKTMKSKLRSSVSRQIEMANMIERQISKKPKLELMDGLERCLVNLQNAKTKLVSPSHKLFDKWDSNLAVDLEADIEQTLGSIGASMTNKFNTFLHEIEKSIEYHNLDAAQSSLDEFEVCYDRVAAFVGHNLKTEHARIAKLLEQHLIKLINVYKTMPVSDYGRHFPKLLVEKLEKSENYQQKEASMRIRGSIKQSLNNFMHHQNPSLTLPEKLNVLEDLIWYIPSDIGGHFQEKIQSLRKTLDDKKIVVFATLTEDQVLNSVSSPPIGLINQTEICQKKSSFISNWVIVRPLRAVTGFRMDKFFCHVIERSYLSIFDYTCGNLVDALARPQLLRH